MDNQTSDILNIKRFGYVISALLIIISNISLIKNWNITPVLFLVTMYFLTGALWSPFLIKPFYNLFGKKLLKNPNGDKESEDPEDLFSKN